MFITIKLCLIYIVKISPPKFSTFEGIKKAEKAQELNIEESALIVNHWYSPDFRFNSLPSLNIMLENVQNSV